MIVALWPDPEIAQAQLFLYTGLSPREYLFTIARFVSSCPVGKR
jgi:hypothetical protein